MSLHDIKMRMDAIAENPRPEPERLTEFPAEQFNQAQENKLGEYSGRFKAQSNYASAIGNPCTRALVYARITEQGIPMDAAGVARMKEGEDQEKAVIRWLEVFGFDVIQQQERFSFDEPLIHGKIDGVIVMRDQGYEVGKWPIEIKSIQPEDWDRLNTQEDIRHSEKSWHAKWYAQMQLAIHYFKDTRGFGPWGVLMLKDKTAKRVKPISFSYDEEMIERCFEKGGEINRHVAEGTLPDRISYASGTCKWCDYRLICNPEEIFQAGKNIQDHEFLAKLREYYAIEASSKRADALWNYIKEILRGVEFAVCGEFQIEGKQLKNGWKVNITQVFTPAVEELTTKSTETQTPKSETNAQKSETKPLKHETKSINIIYENLVRLIESADSIANLKAVCVPAKSARDSGKITPLQANQLSKLYDARIKSLDGKKVA